MAFFDKLLGKQKQIHKEKFQAFVEGSLINIRDVSDEMFAQEIMGRSVAIVPEKGIVIAPCDGILTTVFETKHALGITTQTGAELLIHIGIDTVHLKGEHFTVLMKEGDKIRSGQPIVEFDLDEIINKKYSPVTILVVTNSDKFQTFDIMPLKKVDSKDTVMEITREV